MTAGTGSVRRDPWEGTMLKTETQLAIVMALGLSALALLPGRSFGGMEPADRDLGGDAERGALLYDSRCIGCHSLAANRIGPRHDDVFGREVGSLDDYDYSPALKQSTLVWDVESLDRWLADPEAFLPGQRMNFLVEAPEDRRDLIAFLMRAAQGSSQGSDQAGESTSGG
ncbi:MAG TPA: c-type cytochrome [Kiloniellaceae bacterium]|nr:c-type cytochrome [Kiloniellaceae bacterium]